MSRPNRALMITDWKQAWLAKMSVRGLQEEVNEANNMLGVVLDPPKPRISCHYLPHMKSCYMDDICTE